MCRPPFDGSVAFVNHDRLRSSPDKPNAAHQKAKETANQGDRDTASQRLSVMGRGWMKSLRAMANAAQDDNAYFEVLRRLEEYGRTLEIPREDALEDFTR